jgi:23S rRNA (adenine2503-C2)-methyltransferase
LVGLTSGELAALAESLGAERYRGSQVAHGLYKKAARSVEAIVGLPRGFRARLAEEFRVDPLVLARRSDAADGVVKLLLHGDDGKAFESVLLPFPARVGCCLSSQVGCPMACSFCATGLNGFERNLGVDEIVGQFLWLQSVSPRRISHAVFMGMGEPLLNLDNVVRAIGLLHSEVGLSLRQVTVSTVGLVPQIRRLAELRLPIHLALSLHSPRDEVRRQIMPVNRKWGVEETVGAMREYCQATRRKVTFEVLLIEGVTDEPSDAALVARLVRGLPCVVNLIPFNFVSTGQGFRRPSRNRVAAYRAVLEGAGVNVTERQERGQDIAAACGQLAGQQGLRFLPRTGAQLAVR